MSSNKNSKNNKSQYKQETHSFDKVDSTNRYKHTGVSTGDENFLDVGGTISIQPVNRQSYNERTNPYLEENYPSYTRRKELYKNSPVQRKLTEKDWQELKKKFIHGIVVENENTGVQEHYYPELKELAHQYGVAPGTVYDKSSKGQWAKIKRIMRLKLKEKRSAADLRDTLISMNDVDMEQLKALQKVDLVINRIMSAYEESLLTDDDMPSPYHLKSLVDTMDKSYLLRRKLTSVDEYLEKLHEEYKKMEKTDDRVKQVENNDIQEADEILDDLKKYNWMLD